MRTIGKYEILRPLGKGATADVYLGRDPFARREVAIKLASPDALKDPERGRLYAKFFLNEASLVGKLAHPHIVQIYDAAVAENLSYIAMEYVAGGTLEDFCAPHRLLAVERVAEIAFKCSRALDFAFHLGITHRDIKPANILYAAGQRASGSGGHGPDDVKISDFGAAITGGVERSQTAGIGSPAYMSPQQVREQPLDQRTDIYSLGVVMYQLLTGQLPFQASNNYNMIYQIINAEPPPPSALRAGIPPELDAIVARAMNKDAEARYPTWDAFARDLAQVFRDRHLRLPALDFAESEKFDTLRALPFFAAFSDVEIWEVLRFSHWSRAAPGATIMHEGERGDFFCFLAEGELKVAKGGRILNLLTAGECFGEMAVISGAAPTRGADVVALTEAKIVTVRGEALGQASEACRMHFYQAFLEVLAGRLALANTRLAAF